MGKKKTHKTVQRLCAEYTKADDEYSALVVDQRRIVEKLVVRPFLDEPYPHDDVVDAMALAVAAFSGRKFGLGIQICSDKI